MNTINIKLSATLLAIFSFITTAHAGFDITNMATIVDDYQGSYTVTKSGRKEEANFNGTSITEFSNFHPFPNNEGAKISGALSKVINKSEEGLTTTSEAEITFVTSENTLNIEFSDLVATFANRSIILAGEITVNDETYDATELPKKLAVLLKKIFQLTKE